MRKSAPRTHQHPVPRARSTTLRAESGDYARQARAGIDSPLPAVETFPNQYRGYEIKIEVPEFTSICPKTNLPDFATLTLRYAPERLCVELKSFKYYIQSYRNLGIFYENAINRVLDDVCRATKPHWAEVSGEFATRGGMRSIVTARYPRLSKPPHA